MSKIKRATMTLWDFHCVYDDLQTADLIVGLGSYDLRVAARCAELYHAGLSRRIVFTGASGNWTRGLFPSSEAEAFSEHVRDLGVPYDAVTLETSATNIGENITLTAQLFPDANSAILITKPQTQRRCQATVSSQWPSLKAMVSAPLTRFADQPTLSHDQRA